METVVVIDYSMGNLRSVAKALEHVASPHQRIAISSAPEAVAAATRIVFPGQGAMRDCMAELDARGLRDAILEAATTKPFLGICMGLQGLMETSDESPGTPGLGLLKGGVKRLPAADEETGERLKIPHMGWNRVTQRGAHPLWADIEDGERFYFVHSFHVVPAEPEVTTGTTRYGTDFVCAIARDNLFAVQFHPEKSQQPGLRLMANFLAWRP
ncbi:MAG: imidazole glycerol phosphate synthase subunit HisH [Gammaproteobacteria bacterium]|nr:imidazole glycerol phosphate synthase subunit HisH [Gammaproteobacteria bacterium]